MRVPVVVSRTSPTSLSVALAEAWNVTLVGYVRRDSLNVYTGQAMRGVGGLCNVDNGACAAVMADEKGGRTNAYA